MGSGTTKRNSDNGFHEEREKASPYWMLLVEDQVMRALPMDSMMSDMPYIDIHGHGRVGVDIDGRLVEVETDLWSFFVTAVDAYCAVKHLEGYRFEVLQMAFEGWIDSDRAALEELGFNCDTGVGRDDQGTRVVH